MNFQAKLFGCPQAGEGNVTYLCECEPGRSQRRAEEKRVKRIKPLAFPHAFSNKFNDTWKSSHLHQQRDGVPESWTRRAEHRSSRVSCRQAGRLNAGRCPFALNEF